MKKCAILMLAAGLILGAAAASSQAEELNIQALIDGAATGETVLIPAGIYRVNLVLKAGVILEGAGAETTILDGGGVGPVIVAEGGGVVKGFTITNGIEGVKASGGPAGIFENVITGNSGSGIRVGGGSAVIVNNLISGNRGAGIDTARAFILAVNNTVCGGERGFGFWKSPGSIAANNLVALSRVGLGRDEESEPDFFNNLLTGNITDFSPFDFPGENFREPAPAAGCRLDEDSPYRESGAPVEGVPEELTAGIGALLPAAFPLETYLGIMAEAGSREPGEQTLVEYELLDEPGIFRVSTFFPRPEFKIASSTEATRIDDPMAVDRESGERLIERLVADDPSAVEVWGWGGVDYPREDDRYVLESFFTKPESYFVSLDGQLNFIRETNFARIRVLIPEGYRIESFSPEGEIDPETGAVTILNPARELIEINLTLSPL
ncbi:MAG: right-handed parallel beta-helix repeat-containing protein [Candidatus Erginobacter occultus]|nr:right-handed parallel beta-helix repeat-containing protein [Candidatus Erginobacter occultus]